MRPLLFALLVLVITGLSAADAYFNMIYHPCDATEENPTARFILYKSDNNVPILITLKFFGTLLAANILWLIYLWKQRLAWLVASGTLAGAVVILGYMLLG